MRQAGKPAPRPKPPDTRRQIARFLVVGTASVGVDLAVYALLTAVTPLAWGISKGISYAVGVVVGFFGNKFWTFESRRRSAAEPVMYLVLYSLTLLLNIACNQLALTALGPQSKLVAFLFATGVTMVTNFLGMKYVTFRRGMQRPESQVHSPQSQPIEPDVDSGLWTVDLPPSGPRG